MKTVGLASPKSKKPKKCPKQPRSQKSLKMALGRALCILQNFEEVQKKRGVPIKNKHWRAQLARSLRSLARSLRSLARSLRSLARCARQCLFFMSPTPLFFCTCSKFWRMQCLAFSSKSFGVKASATGAEKFFGGCCCCC
jgi:hypothetical protein